jgi:glucose/arabinose dehydrogenase
MKKDLASLIYGFVLLATLPGASAFAQGMQAPNAPGSASNLAAQFCASCHGPGLVGGRAQSLVDDTWTFGGDDKSIALSIRDGRANGAMPAFKASLSESQILALVTYIHEEAMRKHLAIALPKGPGPGDVVKSEKHAFKIELVADGLDTPWGMAFLPDSRLIVTERPGRLRLITPGQPLPAPVTGLPKVWAVQDGGLMDIALHPDYGKNGWIYLSYVEPGSNGASMTVIVRGHVRDGKWVDQEILYKAPPELYWADNTHFGSRFLFDKDGHLFYSIGDRGHKDDAQDLSRPNGKIHRVFDDGRIPKDNPFVGRAGALGSIWSYGNRNAQGLAFHPVTGELWETEHGPRGGDELNRIEPGHNYGWPVITYGIDYDGTPIADKTEQPGMDQPVTQWTPSLATCAIAFYTGHRFPNWKNDLFLTTLVAQELRRLVLEGHKVLHQEVLIRNSGRIRDVLTGPDGFLYVVFNQPGRIVRLVPVSPSAPAH